MKTRKLLALALALTLSVLLLSACGGTIFALSENSEKRMTILAKNADKYSYFVVGSLSVEKGEKIVLSSGLKKGSIRVEIIGTPAEQSIDQLPEIGEARLSADLSDEKKTSGTVPPGTYLLRAICLHEASGSIRIEVLPE